jgi:glycogen debranching enzyme
MTTENVSLIRLRPRPDVSYISRNRTIWITGTDGFTTDESEHGLFVHQTRVLSRYRYLIDGRPMDCVSVSAVEQHSWLGHYIYTPKQGGNPAQHAVELRARRLIHEGCHEDLDLTNYTGQHCAFEFEIELDADFASREEMNGKRKQRGDLERQWNPTRNELLFDYRAEHSYEHQGEKGTASIHRGLIVRIERATTPGRYSWRKLRFAVDLPAGGKWHVCLEFVPTIDARAIGSTSASPAPCRDENGSTSPHRDSSQCVRFAEERDDYERKRGIFLGESGDFSAPGQESLTPVVITALTRAKRDLAALRLYDFDVNDRAWTPAAGLPIYIGLFGRDALITSWQTALISTGPMLGTLAMLSASQTDETNDWRDAQPGRMIHQIQDSALAELNYTPFGRYYGELSSPVFYCELVFALWLWTGDRALVETYIPPALRALEWLEKYARSLGPNLYAYKSRSEGGLKHQFWKDSGESVVYEDGTQVQEPIATCEMQGLAYMVMQHLTHVLRWLGDKDTARSLKQRARQIKDEFEDRFWMSDLDFYAMALDPDGRQIRSISSDIGACLAAGIVDTSRARRTADRLMAEDLFSG